MKTSKRRFLFIHQNFPGQFVHLAAALGQAGHEVVALGIEGRELPGVRYLRYRVPTPKHQTSIPLLRDIEAKVVRGSACAMAMSRLDQEGFQPDVIVAHPGWGEALFSKDIWPGARLIVFAEFFYNANGADYNFDPEFDTDNAASRSGLRIKNTALLHALHACDAAYAPTVWQRRQSPLEYQQKIEVLFDGIDTDRVRPNPAASVNIPQAGLTLTAHDEVVTFVNRNLEPYRGFHSFMRALPAILEARPKAYCVIVGRDEISYGKKPASGGSWRETMLKELQGRLPLDRVHFLGNLPYAQYLNVLQVSSCHVYLTYPFVLGWSCFEAMAAGCTIVGSNTAPVREVIEHEKNGILVDFFDVNEIARQVVRCLDKPDAISYLGIAARAAMVGKYDLRSVSLPALLKFVD